MGKIRLDDPHMSDTYLWGLLKSGDEEAFSILFRRYYKKLVQYGRSLTTEEDFISDCVQDVFVDIWNYRQNISESIVVKAYLLTSVRNRIAKKSIEAKRFARFSSQDVLFFDFDFSVEEKLILDEDSAEKIRRLNTLINSLPPKQKEAIYLRYHMGLSVEQISLILNMNYQSTKNLLHRTILSLRKEFPLSILFLYGSLV